MHKLFIHHLGPIEKCELECSRFLTFTGFQASGKSTIAKVIYYFRTIKEDILELAKDQAFDAGYGINGFEDEFHMESGMELKEGLEKYLEEKFCRTFGSLWTMPEDMRIEYYFTETCFVKVLFSDNIECTVPGHLRITFSSGLVDFLDDKNSIRGIVHQYRNLPTYVQTLIERNSQEDLSWFESEFRYEIGNLAGVVVMDTR